MKVKKVNKANVKTCLARNWLTIATFAGVMIGIAIGILSLRSFRFLHKAQDMLTTVTTQLVLVLRTFIPDFYFSTPKNIFYHICRGVLL